LCGIGRYWARGWGTDFGLPCNLIFRVTFRNAFLE
jgi:hypothetical protein